MALTPEIQTHVETVKQLSKDGKRRQRLQEHRKKKESSLELYEARCRYEAAFAALILELVMAGYTQLVTGSILTENRFDDELFFLGASDDASESLTLPKILTKVQREKPENDTYIMSKLSNALQIISDLSIILNENAQKVGPFPELLRVIAPIRFWSWSKWLDQPVFRVDPSDNELYQEGSYSALEIRNWIYGLPSKIHKKTPDRSLDYENEGAKT